MEYMLKIIIILYILNFIKNKDCFEYSCEDCLNSDYGSCIKCKENFILKDGTCPCNDFACHICDTSYAGSKCYHCDKNYKLNSKNQCECEIPNCEICGNNGKCLKCDPYFEFSDGICKLIANYKPKCLDENCYQCENNDEKYTCTKCNLGYELVMGECKELPKAINNRCEDDYYISIFTGICYPKYIGSLKKECFNKCFECFEYKLHYYIDCNAESNINNCNIQKNDNECSICNIGYYKKKGQCEKCPKGCRKCFNKETCIVCDPSYYLLDDGSCKEIKYNSNKEIEEEFKQFQSNYLIAKSKYLAIKENITNNNTEKYLEINKICDIKNCLKCSSENDNYCLRCQQDYENYNGKCLKKNCEIEGCETCDKKNVCSKCENGYSLLLNNTCEPICNIENCEICQTPYGCKKCKIYYGHKIKSFSSCNKCNDHCKKCDGSLRECTECDFGYKKYYITLCELICDIKDCDYCTDFNKCGKCKYDMELIDNKCRNRFDYGFLFIIIFYISISISIFIDSFIYINGKCCKRVENNENNNINNRNIIFHRKNNNTNIRNNINNSIDDNNKDNKLRLNIINNSSEKECQICCQENVNLRYLRCHSEGCKGKICNECYNKILKGVRKCPFCKREIH